MSVREWLIKTLSHRDFIPQTTINAIVTHSYERASEALKDNNSIEISGFGNFYFNEKKANKQMAKCMAQKEAYQQVLDDEGISEKKRHAYEKRMNTVDKNIETLKGRGYEQDSRDL